MIIPIILLVAFGMVVGWIIYVLIRSWNTKTFFSLVGMSFSYVVWTLSNVAISLPVSEDTLWNIRRVSGIGWSLFPLMVLIFCIQITMSFNRWQRIVTYLTGGILAAWFIVLNLFWPVLFVTRFERSIYGMGIIRSGLTISYSLLSAYIIICSLLILFLLGRWYITGTSRIVKRQSKLLFGTALFSFVVGTFVDILLPTTGISIPGLAPLLLTGWFFGVFLSVHEQRFLHSDLQLTVSELMSHMREMSFVLSPDGVVLLMNASARKTLGYDRSMMGKINIRSLASEVRLPKGDIPLEMHLSLKTIDGYEVPVSACISARYNQYGDPLGFFLHAMPLASKYGFEGTIERRQSGHATEKSVALKAVMTYFDEAVLFVGADGLIRPEYSPFCRSLFNVQELAGRSFSDLAFTGMDKQEQAALRSILNSIFIEERTWRLDALMPMLPAQIKLDHATWDVEYRMLSTQKTTIERVLMVRITSLAISRIETEHVMNDNDPMKMIVTVISKKSAFYDLMQEYEQFFHMDVASFLQLARTPRETLYELYRNVHTFKSRFARLNMNSTRDNLNCFEDTLQPLLDKEVTLNIIRSIYADIAPDAWVRNDLDNITRALGQNFLKNQNMIEVDRSVLDNIAHEMENLTHGPECIRLTTRFREMYCIRILAELREYGDYVRKLGMERMNVEPEFIVEGYDLLLDSKTYRYFLQSMVHVFNNIVGHGLESVDERIANGKPPKSRIECHVQKRQDRLLIEVADDGRGVDIERIREGLRRKGHAIEADTKSSQEILQMIFEPGFSTLMTADEVSGRGIGLFAVSQAVKQMGGKIDIISKRGLYTRFEFDLPLIRMTESEQK